MTAYILPTTIYRPPPQVRREARVTLIEDEIQVNIPSFHIPAKLTITSPMGDDVPTPRAIPSTITPATDATSDSSSMWSHRSSKSSFDSLYDLTDESEGEEVPLKLSASVKKQVNTERSRYPSLIIPSPSQWPSIHKPQNSFAIGLSPASRLATSPSALSVWQAQTRRISSGSSTPSLDGSLTSEELALSSCPSTPDSAYREGAANEWDVPIQLHPDAFDTLHQLSPEMTSDHVVEHVLEIPEEAANEMKEIVKTTPMRLDFALMSVDPEDDSQDPVSALSVPSPGGFFSSLAPTAAQTWAIRTPEPSTTTAESFYGVPWRVGADVPSERTIITSLSPSTRGPLTATRIGFSSPIEEVDVAEITAVCQPSDYNEEYQQKLKQSALAHFERTKLWLNEQITMLRKDSDPAPSTPVMSNTPTSASTPSKKSVRFASDSSPKAASCMTQSTDEVPSPLKKVECDDDSIFYEAFIALWQRNKKSDAWVHGQARLEALHIERRSFPQLYREHVNGRYEISNTIRPRNARPISTMMQAPDAPADDVEFKETVLTVERERQALEQVSAASWDLQAMSYLRGGNLIRADALKHLNKNPESMILDYNGKPNCSWAWQVALEHPKATVHTTIFGHEATQSILQGPTNHIVTALSKPFALPFEDNTFDLISARTLHVILKTDEYDHTLSELHRILKPNGFLDFSIIDSALQNQSQLGQAMSVEVGFGLKTLGYDAHPTQSFLPRLDYAGFKDVKRTWMALPMGDVRPVWRDEAKTPVTAIEGGSRFFQVPKEVTKDGRTVYHEPAVTGSVENVKAVTGLLGSRMWEQWVLKHAFERGAHVVEEKLLAQICRVLEEGGKKGSAVSCLIGSARK